MAKQSTLQPDESYRQNDDGLWTTKDVATYLNVSVQSVRRYVEKNGLPFIRHPGGGIRYEPDAVRAWVRSGGKQAA